MVTLTTATEAVNHWAPEAARIDHMLHNLDDLLPETAEGQTPIAEETRQYVEDALMQARLGMDTVLGAYSRVLFHERTVIQRYQPHLVSPQTTASTRSGTGRLRGLLGGGRWHQAGGRGSVRWPAPLVVAGEPAPAPVRHNAPIPPERIQHTQLKESPRAVFAGDSDSTDTSVMVDRWRSKARRSRIPEFVKTTRMIRKNRDGIDATIDRGLSNGRQEGGLCGTP